MAVNRAAFGSRRHDLDDQGEGEYPLLSTFNI